MKEPRPALWKTSNSMLDEPCPAPSVVMVTFMLKLEGYMISSAVFIAIRTVE